MFQAAIHYFKETAVERKLLQMAKIYMAEADFDDSDVWFHDGNDDGPEEQDVTIEVRSIILTECEMGVLYQTCTLLVFLG